MLEKPIVVLPLVWTFVPNAFAQLLKILRVKFSILGLTKAYEFLVDNSSDVEEKLSNLT
jgi:hypothetical protein